MKRNAFILFGFFILVISFPLIGELSGIRLAGKLNENRYIKGYDSLSWADRTKLYVRNFDSKFWGREYLVKAYIIIKKELLGVSPLPEKLVIGKGDWLYLADYGAMDDYRNLHPFSDSQLDSIQFYLTNIAHALAERNKKFYVVVVPDKHTIYPEFLPDNITKINPTSRLQQVTERLKSNTNFCFMNLTDTLLNVKKNEQVYFKEESHWNDVGAFAGYHYIMNAIKSDFSNVEILRAEECDMFQGEESDIDLMKLLGEDISYTESSRRIVPKDQRLIENVSAGINIPEAKKFNPYYAYRKINPNTDGGKIIIFRDSYFDFLEPFFERSFSVSTYIWTTNIDLNYALDEDADIVLLELAERHLYLITH